MLRWLLSGVVGLGCLAQFPNSNYVTEMHVVCTPEQGHQARCGPGANCLVLGGVPTCHCIIDATTGLPLAGNPYRGCTWDLTGKWVVNLAVDELRGAAPLSNPFSNEPFVIHIDRTDAVLKTQYITGTIFVITAVTGAATGICARAFVDVNDNSSVIFELAEGFVDGYGRNMFFRNRQADVSLSKKLPKYPTAGDVRNLNGYWKKYDGSKVKIAPFKYADDKYGGQKPWKGGNTPAVITPGWAYWYNDDSFGAPAVRLSAAIFLDETLPFEQAAFDTTNRFVQVGWYGSVAMGARSIHIRSPGDGKEIFTIARVADYDLPLAPPPAPATITLTGVDQIKAIQQAATNALPVPPVLRKLSVMNMTGEVAFNPNQRPRSPTDDAGVFTGQERLLQMLKESGVELKEFSQARLRALVRQTNTTHSHAEVLDLPYPAPIESPVCSAPRRELNPMRGLSPAPRSTLEDLKKFKNLAVAANNIVGHQQPQQAHSPLGTFINTVSGMESGEHHHENDVFWKSESFGLEGESNDAPYEVLWRRMSVRLRSAELTADEVLRKLAGKAFAGISGLIR